MRIKNLSLVDRHIEKLVLGLSVIFSGLVVYGFVLADYTVNFKGQPRKPGEIVEQISKEQRNVAAKIAADAPSPIDESKIVYPDWPSELKRLIDEGAPAPIERLQYPNLLTFAGLGSEALTTQDGGTKLPLHVPTPPAIASIEANTAFGMLGEPANPRFKFQLLNLIGMNNPPDFHWVSVSGQFPMRRWRELLEQDPPTGEEVQPRKIPSSLWGDNMAIGAVLLERQTFEPSINGWGAVETIAPLPGMPQDFADQEKIWGRVDGPQAVQELKDRQNDILRPSFVRLAENVWLPPNADPKQLDSRQQTRFIELQREIQALQRRIANEGFGGGAAAPAAGAGAGNLGGPAIPAAGTGAGTPITRGAGGQGAPRGGGRLALEEDLDQKIHEMLVLFGLEKSTQIGEAVLPGGPADLGTGGFVTAGEDLPLTDEPEEIDRGDGRINVWGHDLTVRPGRTYRYRLRAYVLSPLFKRTNEVPEQQAEIRERLTLPSEPSRWSNPITIEPAYDFYIVGSDRGSQTVTAEVFGIFAGRRMFKRFELKPGDPIGGPVRISMGQRTAVRDMSVGAVLVDIDFDVPSQLSNKPTTRVMLLNTNEAQLVDRTIELDIENDVRRRKFQEAGQTEVGEALARSGN